MIYIVNHMHPNDTFQIVAFADSQRMLFNKPEKVSAEMVAKARKFISALQADGGTWMGLRWKTSAACRLTSIACE